MSIKEGMFYAGAMAGLVIGVTVCQHFDLHRLVGLLVGGVLGIGLGYGLQNAYISLTANQDRRDPGDDPQDRF